jgi:preprotein translocase subunit SecY
MLWSQVAHLFFPDFFTKYFWYLGTFEQHESKLELTPVSGLCYWLTPISLSTLTSYRALVYIIYMLSICAFLSYISIFRDCEENPYQMIEDLLGPTHLTMAGIRHGDSDEALRLEIARLVPVAAILGGLALGIICVVSDILGVIGGAQGMLIATSIISSSYAAWVKEETKLKGAL